MYPDRIDFDSRSLRQKRMRRYLKPHRNPICLYSSSWNWYVANRIELLPITTLLLATILAHFTNLTDVIINMSQFMYSCQSDKRGKGPPELANLTDLTTRVFGSFSSLISKWKTIPLGNHKLGFFFCQNSHRAKSILYCLISDGVEVMDNVPHMIQSICLLEASMF